MYYKPGTVCFRCSLTSSSKVAYAIGSIVTPIFHIMKLKLNEVKWLVPGDPSKGRTRAISLQVPSS